MNLFTNITMEERVCSLIGKTNLMIPIKFTLAILKKEQNENKMRKAPSDPPESQHI